MTEKWKEEKWAEDIWYSGKVTRRRLVGWGGGAIGAMMLVPAPWRAAFGAEKAYKIGSEQPLSGAGAAGGKTAVVGLQMAADRINKNGGINGRPVELDIVDDESSPAVARQKTEKMVQEDNIDAHVGGFLSNICLACMPVWEDAKIVNMISVCLDTTLTTSQCNRYSFRTYDYAPAQAVAFAPDADQDGQEVAHRLCRLFLGPVDARRLYRADQEERRRSGRHHRHPARHRRHDAVPVEDLRRFRRPVRHLLRQGRRDHRHPGLRPRPDQEIQMGRRRLDLGIDQSASRSATRSTASSPSTATSRCSRARSTRPYHHAWFNEAKARLAKIDPSGPLPDKYVQSNFEALNALKIGMEKSKFQGRDDTMKLIEALEGLELKAGPDFPQGAKTMRKEDHQAFPHEFIFEVTGGTYHLIETVPGDKTVVPPACNFSA